jgi:hypothetical protein
LLLRSAKVVKTSQEYPRIPNAWRDLKRKPVAQLVETSRILRNYIDQRAKERGTVRAMGCIGLVARA